MGPRRRHRGSAADRGPGDRAQTHRGHDARRRLPGPDAGPRRRPGPVARLLAGAATLLLLVAGALWPVGEAIGVPGWLASLLGVVVLTASAYAAPTVLGGAVGLVEGLREGAAGRPPDPEAVEHLRGLTLRDVRARADAFEQQARRAEARRPRGAAPHAVPARAWRRLERELRKAGAWTVGDLGDDAVERWARRLGLARDDRPWQPGQRGPGVPTAQVRVEDPPRAGGAGRLDVRGRPTPRVRRPPPGRPS